MKKILLFSILILCTTCAISQTVPERMRFKKTISIVLDDEQMQDFETNNMMNFFIGEFAVYIKSLNVDCVVNKSLAGKGDCPSYDYIKVMFSCHTRLKSNGMWVYDFSDVYNSIRFIM